MKTNMAINKRYILTKDQAEFLVQSCKAEKLPTVAQLVNKGFGNRIASSVTFVLRNWDVLQEAIREKPLYRVLLAGDLHCGHLAGLTPPAYRINPDSPTQRRFYDLQKETWEWYIQQIQGLRPFTHAVWNGDLIEGKGPRSGSTELITADRNLQCDMAVEAIGVVGAKTNVVVYGTPSHVGDQEDFEYNIAKELDAVLLDNDLLEIGGVVMNIRHKIGSSSVPYGAATPLLRDALWSDLWSALEDNPKTDLVVRSHVHTFVYTNDGFRQAIILPALMGAASKYGTRQCSKVVHYGFAYADIYADGSFNVNPVIYSPESQRRQIIKL